jgi:hypothetical protein
MTGPPASNWPHDRSVLDAAYPDLDTFASTVAVTLAGFLGRHPRLSQVQFDSSLPDQFGAHSLFDPGPRTLHLSPERTRLLGRLVFGRERSPDTLAAFTTLVHELVHSASPLFDHEPSMLAQVQTAGWAFWEEGLAAWFAQEFAGWLWFGGSTPAEMQGSWQSYQDEVDRMQWLARTMSPDVLMEIWQEPTTQERLVVANDYVRQWLHATLLQNGMVENEARALTAALGERLWEIVQRNYHPSACTDGSRVRRSISAR